MAFTNSLCSTCLQAVQSELGVPPMDSLVLLGVDYAAGGGAQPVKSTHYGCANCMATWKSTPRQRRMGDAFDAQTWELIDHGL